MGPFESGMLRLVVKLENPLRGTSGGGVLAVAYSPNGRGIISGSIDKTIRIWDAETGAAIGKPLNGHTGSVQSVTYSPNGRHIISGSMDTTIRIWDAKTGAAVGKPLEGHTESVQSVTYSPDGQYIIFGSVDRTFRIRDAETGTAVGRPLEGHTWAVYSVAYSPDGRHIVSGSGDHTIHIWDSFLEVSAQLPSSSDPMHTNFFTRPDPDGWVRDSEGGLLYWVPPDCRACLNSPSLLAIPPTSHIRSVSLDFEGELLGCRFSIVHLSFL